MEATVCPYAAAAAAAATESELTPRHHVFNYVASCIEEAHYSLTLPLLKNLTFDSVLC